VGYFNPRQNQKATVVDEEGKIGLASGIAPSDPGIARRHFPGGAGEQQAGQHIPRWSAHQVAQLRTVGNPISQRMITLDELLKQAAAGEVFDQL
jgi:hypothetical protein